ncbi:peptidoglycan-binding protein [Streptomyces sp. NPDC049687]|uniref:peptidoglycan-binding protein n=1 Tax=Streptomyces sp. NPDC049687 TaxID=3365596 RepID=UPI0037A6FE76
MDTPVFEEFDPASDCDCPGCVHWRRVSPYSPGSRPARFGGHPAAHRTLAVATAAATTLGAGHAVPALAAPHASDRPGVPADDEPETPQGGKAPLHGPGGRPATPPGLVRTPWTTRAEIIRRAKEWVSARVPYSMDAYWADGYRQDCSGFVSMAWNLPGNEWTGTLDQFGTRISKEELQPGDILLFHNPANPWNGSHVVLFGGWTDYTHSYYIAYEETRPRARRQPTPYAYWSQSDRYAAYRYRGLTAGAAPVHVGGEGEGESDEPDAGSEALPTPYPGRSSFGPGAANRYVTQLGRLLVARGAGRFYTSGPGPRWTDADRRATRAFQWAQGWRGPAADGLPGPATWRLLVTGEGRDIGGLGNPLGAPGAPPPVPTPGPSAPTPPTRIPAFPGRGMFRPGAHNAYVTQLGRQLLRKGFGRYYTTGPGPRWGEADRRAVEAFQRTQGWRGGAADGHPGPETWRRLFS